MPLSEELGQGSELRLLRVGRHALHGLKVLLISEEGGGGGGNDGAGLLTRLVRAAELVDGEKGCSVESALADQMELLKGVVADHGLHVFPRNDAVGAVGELELPGQECRGSLLGTSQMVEEAGVNSGQLG